MAINHRIIKEIIRIRIVEQAFLNLFSEGKLNGTVHTCIGQELSAASFAGQISKRDFVFSNHRCHGHYISYTKEWKPLILELLGKSSGVCGGVGSSQHLHKYNFFSNGIQGGIMPVAAGFALGNKIKKNNNIGIVYIGDGTLGEGAVYETLNFISKKEIPLLVVCENNSYAQSTPIDYTLSGSIKARAKAFGIEFRESNTFNLDNNILGEAKSSIEYVRQNSKPLFHLVNTSRLKAHSKGDDDRDEKEIKELEKKDFLNNLIESDKEHFGAIIEKIKKEVDLFIDESLDLNEMSFENYLEENGEQKKIDYSIYNLHKERQIKLLNSVFHNLMKNNNSIFIGEDILDPYGGAFKVSKGLSTKFPDRVIGTSISESLIAGVANGLALNGFKPYAEFMFGDFTALAFDQLINHSSKFYNMYNKKVNCPVVFRTPMGARRGYGPTHSQSLEKHFVGMDKFEIIALNKYLDPKIVYDYLEERTHPTLLIENKTDYAKKPNLNLPNKFKLYITNEDIPNLIIKPPNDSKITSTIITYGGSSEIVLDNIEKLFYEKDQLIQVLILTKIDPLPESFILENITENTKVITIEEGTERGTIGNNIISLIAKNNTNNHFYSLSSHDNIIPSVKSLEDNVLPSINRLMKIL